MKVIGIITIIVSLFALKTKLDIREVAVDGTIVEMQILSLPSNCNLTKGKYYMDIEYQGQVFNKRIPVGFCRQHTKGEAIKMKFLNGNDNVLFPTESLKGEFIAIGIFLFVGILSLVIGFYRKHV